MVISLVLGKVNSKSTEQYDDIKDTTSTHTQFVNIVEKRSDCF